MQSRPVRPQMRLHAVGRCRDAGVDLEAGVSTATEDKLGRTVFRTIHNSHVRT